MKTQPHANEWEQQPPEIREILARRAERLAAVSKANEEENAQAIWLAGFEIGQDTYAIPLEQMRASLPLKGVAPVPLSPPEIVGIVRFEGQSISVFSLSNLIGEPGWNRDPAVLLVIEPTPGQLIAVDCEQIPTPFSVPASRVTAARTQAKDAVFPVVLEGGRRIQFVDLSALLDARNGARSS